MARSSFFALSLKVTNLDDAKELDQGTLHRGKLSGEYILILCRIFYAINNNVSYFSFILKSLPIR